MMAPKRRSDAWRANMAKTRRRASYMNLLPNELLASIFQFFHPVFVNTTLAHVCGRWKRMLSEGSATCCYGAHSADQASAYNDDANDLFLHMDFFPIDHSRYRRAQVLLLNESVPYRWPSQSAVKFLYNLSLPVHDSLRSRINHIVDMGSSDVFASTFGPFNWIFPKSFDTLEQYLALLTKLQTAEPEPLRVEKLEIRNCIGLGSSMIAWYLLAFPYLKSLTLLNFADFPGNVLDLGDLIDAINAQRNLSELVLSNTRLDRMGVVVLWHECPTLKRLHIIDCQVNAADFRDESRRASAYAFSYDHCYKARGGRENRILVWQAISHITGTQLIISSNLLRTALRTTYFSQCQHLPSLPSLFKSTYNYGLGMGGLPYDAKNYLHLALQDEALCKAAPHMTNLISRVLQLRHVKQEAKHEEAEMEMLTAKQSRRVLQRSKRRLRQEKDQVRLTDQSYRTLSYVCAKCEDERQACWQGASDASQASGNNTGQIMEMLSVSIICTSKDNKYHHQYQQGQRHNEYVRRQHAIKQPRSFNNKQRRVRR